MFFASAVLTEKTRRRLLDGWPGVFRHVILELMPVEAMATLAKITTTLVKVRDIKIDQLWQNPFDGCGDQTIFNTSHSR